MWYLYNSILKKYRCNIIDFRHAIEATKTSSLPIANWFNWFITCVLLFNWLRVHVVVKWKTKTHILVALSHVVSLTTMAYTRNNFLIFTQTIGFTFVWAGFDCSIFCSTSLRSNLLLRKYNPFVLVNLSRSALQESLCRILGNFPGFRNKQKYFPGTLGKTKNTDGNLGIDTPSPMDFRPKFVPLTFWKLFSTS